MAITILMTPICCTSFSQCRKWPQCDRKHYGLLRAEAAVRPRTLKQFLKPERIGLRHAGPMVLRAEWRDRGGLVEPDVGIELLRQGCIGVVAHQLCVRPIDDTDEALQLGLQKPATQRLITVEVEQEAHYAGIMAKPLVAVTAGGSHALDLHVT